jgi:hypothetical protein
MRPSLRTIVLAVNAVLVRLGHIHAAKEKADDLAEGKRLSPSSTG